MSPFTSILVLPLSFLFWEIDVVMLHAVVILREHTSGEPEEKTLPVALLEIDVITERRDELYLTLDVLCTDLPSVAQQTLTKCGLRPEPQAGRVEIATLFSIYWQLRRHLGRPFWARWNWKTKVSESWSGRTVTQKFHIFTIAIQQIQPLKILFIGWQADWGVTWVEIPSRPDSTRKITTLSIFSCQCQWNGMKMWHKQKDLWTDASLQTLFSINVADKASWLARVLSFPSESGIICL